MHIFNTKDDLCYQNFSPKIQTVKLECLKLSPEFIMREFKEMGKERGEKEK